MKRKIAIVAAIVASLVGVTGGAGVAEAWGPVRATYTNENPAEKATFNSITNNAGIGDERNFVRVVEAGSKKAYSDDVDVYADKEYRVYIYYHNNASSTYNKKEYQYRGIAQNVRVATQFPASLKAGETGTVSGVISATNTDPLKVWDEAFFHAKEDVNLYYIAGSAKIYNDWGANGKVLSTNLFSEEGTFIGLDELNGVILGCDEYSGQVIYTVVARAVETKSTPEPDPEPTPTSDSDPEPTPTPEPEPEPTVLPTTGPVQIVTAVVVSLAIIGVALYFYNSQRTLRRVQRSVMGEEEKTSGVVEARSKHADDKKKK